MNKKRVVSIGLELAAADVHHENYRSRASLLDWDIVIFKPVITDFISYAKTFQGKPSLSDSDSFRLKECCEHWRREIKQAVEAGKTVVVYLPELQEVFVDTGERSYSGTGRNQRTTRHVTIFGSYSALPVELGPVIATGNSMKLSARGAEVLASYWAEFEADSHYRVVLTDARVPACVITRTGDKPVGALYRSKSSAGNLLLLPDIEFDQERFFRRRSGNVTWTKEAEQFAARLLASLAAIDKALRSSGEVTPEPSWATAPKFVLQPESDLRIKVLEVERRLEGVQKEKEAVVDQLRSAGSHRALLYEKGKPLENALIDALRLLGFSADRFKDSESEFDVVFESDEGRLIGEAEGKDSKAINIDKLRQLAMNIHEDLQRENTEKPAKPVLFGNSFRLQDPSGRDEPFTEKCRTAAEASSTALVFTPDLFAPVQYLLSNTDEKYAYACRQALLHTTGRVIFPQPPVGAAAEESVSAEK